MANQVMAPLDYEMASIIHSHLVLSDGVKSFESEGRIVVTNNSKRIETGVRPEN